MKVATLLMLPKGNLVRQFLVTSHRQDTERALRGRLYSSCHFNKADETFSEAPVKTDFECVSAGKARQVKAGGGRAAAKPFERIKLQRASSYSELFA